jgi:hypothetical protein
MAEKTLREFTALSIANIHTGPTLNTNNVEFELKPVLIKWCKLHRSMERYMKMQVFIYRIF